MNNYRENVQKPQFLTLTTPLKISFKILVMSLLFTSLAPNFIQFLEKSNEEALLLQTTMIQWKISLLKRQKITDTSLIS